ncbi:MAG: UPF0182 family protein, partial [Acidobacteriaceae bacterium]|nr:UPF0182 family protein [Acidobacteriaceae bacterium]
MTYPDEESPRRYIGQRKRRGGVLFVVVAIVIILAASRYIASTLIDYSWWQELHQVDTWISLLIYGTGPLILTILIFLAAFWIAFELGIRHQPKGPLFGFVKRSFVSKIALAGFAILAVIAANATVDSWTVVRYFAGLRLPASMAEFVDPIFHKPLHFYFFILPFYSMLLRLVLVGAVLVLLIYWLALNADSLTQQLRSMQSATGFELERFSFGGAFHSKFVRLAVAVVLCGLAIKFYFSRYGFLLEDHGAHLVGVDWTTDHIALPLQWLMIAGAVAAAALVLASRARMALLLLLILPVRYIVPAIVAGLYVRPNELAVQRPYIQDHINATRSAYGLNQRVTETSREAAPEIPIDYAKHQALLDNVRLWDWRAFHDTISQIQPLRPYAYIDTDVDRYDINGKVRQVLISPRELDIRQLGSASWVNTHLMYTHGYGMVMAEANRNTPDGLPVLFVKDAPPVVTVNPLKFTRPELYYS